MTLHKDMIRAFNTGIIACITILFVITAVLSVQIIESSVDEILFEKAVTRVEALAREAGNIIRLGGDTEDLQAFVDREAESADVLYAIIIDDTVTAIAHSESYTVGWTYMDPYTTEAIASRELRSTMWYSENLHEWARDIMVPVTVDGEYLFSLSVGIVPEMGTDAIVGNLIKKYIVICLLGIVIFSVVITRLAKKYITPIVESAKKIQDEYVKANQSLSQRTTIHEIVSNVNSIVSGIEKSMGQAGGNTGGKGAAVLQIENAKEEVLLKIKLSPEVPQEIRNLDGLENKLQN